MYMEYPEYDSDSANTDNNYVDVTAPVAFIHWLHGHKIAVQIDGYKFLAILPQRINCEHAFLAHLANISKGKGIIQFKVWTNDYFLVEEEEIILQMLWRSYNTELSPSIKNN